MTAPPEFELLALERGQLDITDPGCVGWISTQNPDVIINCAGYTAVDAAEQDAAQAFAVNATGAAHLARAAKICGARLVHVSTDFVFDGASAVPYCEDAATAPLGVYGASKLAGEQRIQEIAGDKADIVRTAWLYSGSGSNFVLSMLRLMREHQSVAVIADQVGTPTWARGLAGMIWSLVASDLPGRIWHWTDLGVASWYDFAVAIQDEALLLGLLSDPQPVKPQRSEDYPRPAKRPGYSVLDKTRTLQQIVVPGVHWRHALREMLAELSQEMESS